MGIWGSQILENDTALDFVESTIERLKHSIVSDLQSALEDGILERPILAAVACLAQTLVLVHHPNRFVSHDEVFAWREQYLSWFDSNAPEFGAPESFLKELRVYADEEFLKLARRIDESN